MRFVVLLCLVSMQALAVGPEATYGTKGMVVSPSTLASEAGVRMMEQGGNAVDAAVATAFALAVTFPAAGNIGGGGFAVVRLADGKVVTLDHRETAPAGAKRDMYLDDNGDVLGDLSIRSHLASGIPGSVDGLLVLLETHGTLSRKQVMAPAIQLARKGFPLSDGLAKSFVKHLPEMEKYPSSVAKFTNRGKPYKTGDIFKQPDLATTLKRISDKGRAGFYEGPVADRIVEEMARGGGIISYKDLAYYRSVWRSPVKSEYRGYDIYGMGPPSSGGVLVAQMLHMLEPFDLKAMGWGSAEYLHHLIEAMRRSYADRAEHLGDPGFVQIPMEMLLDRSYAKQRFATFDPDKATRSEAVAAGHWPEESRETTHFSVMDDDGMMVGLTTTLNSSYGNHLVVTGAGFLLNNEMNDFSIKPDTPNQYDLIGRDANAIAPGKRMLSSMSPTLVVKDGEPVLITGSMGGSRIITTTLQVILNVIDHGMTIDDAVSLPRIHHQWKPNIIIHDHFALSPDTRNALEAKGHKGFRPWETDRGIGNANSILRQDGVMSGIKDPRGEGVAVGY